MIELNRTMVGDCRDSMRELIASGVRVQMCVTSPPYWGLRDYGMAAQIGVEPTMQQYVDTMVEVFRMVRELLDDDGTLWLNLGDSYAGRNMTGGTASKENGRRADRMIPSRNTGAVPIGLKAKDLIGIPWRIAFALQADGWWLRQDIIWHKPNPMPESVLDRCTKAHEYLFLLSKSERYHFDAAAISEEAVSAGEDRGGGVKYSDRTEENGIGGAHNLATWGATGERRNKRSVWTVATEPYAEVHFATFPRALIEPCILAGSRVGDIVFDPFIGSGTTGQVAQDLGRRWIGCELNPEYVKLERKRTAQQAMILDAPPSSA